MDFNFDQCLNRKNTSSSRWDLISTEFNNQELIGLRIADIDFNTPPNILKALQNRLSHPILGYAYKDPHAFHTMIDFYQKQSHFSFNADDLLISAGIIPIIAASILTFTKEGDEILFQTPGYPPLKRAIEGNNRVMLENPMYYDDEKGYMIDFDDIEKKISSKTKIWLLCSPHNPTGRVWTYEELKQIERIALKYNLLIVSDEINGFLTFKEKAYIPIASISEEIANRTIIASSPGKIFGITGLTYSFAIVKNKILKEKLAETFESLGLIFSARNTLGLTAVEAAYTNENALWLTKMMEYVKKNYDFTHQFFEKNLPKIKVKKSDGTFTLWIDFSALNLSPTKIEELLINKAHVVLLSGEEFGYGGYFRMNIGTCLSTLKTALENIKNTFHSL